MSRAAAAAPLGTPGQWWARMGIGKRIALGLLAVVVGLNATLWGIQIVTGGADPGGPASSSFATGDEGVKAWSDLLELRGRTVSRRARRLSDEPVDPASTLVVADPDALDGADLDAIEAFLVGGGRLVAVGSFSAVLAGPDVRWNAVGVKQAVVREGRAGGARTLAGSGRGSFDGPLGPGVEILAEDDDVVVATVTTMGGGGVVAVADSGMVHNERLASDDNAAFALAVVGDDRPVVFLETVHGFGATSGLGALPHTARWTLGGLVCAALVGMWCAGQRFGPPEERTRTFPPPRTAYVEAMAVTLERSGSPSAAVEPLRHWARRAVAARPGSAEAVLSPHEMNALDSPSDSEADLLAIGRAAARLRAGDTNVPLSNQGPPR